MCKTGKANEYLNFSFVTVDVIDDHVTSNSLFAKSALHLVLNNSSEIKIIRLFLTLPIELRNKGKNIFQKKKRKLNERENLIIIRNISKIFEIIIINFRITKRKVKYCFQN